LRKHTLENKILAITLSAVLVLATPFLAGCNTNELQASITVGVQVLEAANTILAPVDPQIGVTLIAAATDMKLLGTLIAQYDSAVASGKPGIQTQIEAVLNTLAGNLSAVLAATGTKNPELLKYIRVAVAVANSTIQIIVAHLPASPAPTVTQAAIINSTAGLTPAIQGDHKALKAAWNDAVRVNYPKAVIK
jgi:hypothetical protein